MTGTRFANIKYRNHDQICQKYIYGRVTQIAVIKIRQKEQF